MDCVFANLQWRLIEHLLPGGTGQAGKAATNNDWFVDAAPYRYRAISRGDACLKPWPGCQQRKVMMNAAIARAPAQCGQQIRMAGRLRRAGQGNWLAFWAPCPLSIFHFTCGGLVCFLETGGEKQRLVPRSRRKRPCVGASGRRMDSGGGAPCVSQALKLPARL